MVTTIIDALPTSGQSGLTIISTQPSRADIHAAMQAPKHETEKLL
ncbi:hypothetical protein [Methylobacillus flagellatus]|nr:hypothetical protein [Methylobacillus flagellatus]